MNKSQFGELRSALDKLRAASAAMKALSWRIPGLVLVRLRARDELAAWGIPLPLAERLSWALPYRQCCGFVKMIRRVGLR